MDLPRELYEITYEKWLWISCSGKILRRVPPAQFAQLKRRGWLDLLQPHKNAPLWAVKRGDIQVLEVLYNKRHHKFKTPYLLCKSLVKKGDLAVFKWYWAHFPRESDISYIYSWIGMWGRQELAYWFYTNVTHKFSPEMYERAGENGRIEFLKWAFDKEDNIILTAAITANAAARYGQLPVLQWLFQEFGKFHRSVWMDAVSWGQTHVVEWIKDKIK